MEWIVRMVQYLSVLVVLVSVVLLLFSISSAVRFVRTSPSTRTRWILISGLLVLLLVSYLVNAFLLINFSLLVHLLVVVSTLLIGSICIFLIFRASGNTIAAVKKLHFLEAENVHIKIVQQRLRNILDNAAESIITFNERGTIESFNHAAEKLFGFDSSVVVGKSISTIIPERKEKFLSQIGGFIDKESELMGRNQDGDDIPISIKVSEMVLNGARLYSAIISDISERAAMMQKLQDLADHDSLTNLFNRRYFLQQLEETLALVKRESLICCLLYFDLDYFKNVNDSFGHSIGDEVLVEAANLLRDSLRKSDCVARLGGDEFAILLFGTNADSGVKIAEKLRLKFAKHSFRVGDQPLALNCCIGVYFLHKMCSDAGKALSNADQACYEAKREGRNRVQLYVEKGR